MTIQLNDDGTMTMIERVCKDSSSMLAQTLTLKYKPLVIMNTKIVVMIERELQFVTMTAIIIQNNLNIMIKCNDSYNIGSP